MARRMRGGRGVQTERAHVVAWVAVFVAQPAVADHLVGQTFPTVGLTLAQPSVHIDLGVDATSGQPIPRHCLDHLGVCRVQ